MEEQQLKELYPINYDGYDIRVEIGNYTSNNLPSISLMCWDEEMGIEEPYSVVTTNLEDLTLPANEVVIKDYDNGEDFYKLLVKHDIIEKHHGKIEVGYGHGYICELKDQREDL